MKKFIFAFLLLPFLQSVHASNSVAHAYFADRYLEHFPNYTEEQKLEFYAGTLFPDIRDLDSNVYDLTHIEGVTLQGVLEEKSPFIAGWKLHCLVDDVRTAFMKEWDILEKISDLDVVRRKTFLKVIEDVMVFDKFNRGLALESTKNIYDEERKLISEEKTIQKWHVYNAVLLACPPHQTFQELAESNEGFLRYSADDLKDWSEHYQEALEREDIQGYFQKLLDHFEVLFQQSNS